MSCTNSSTTKISPLGGAINKKLLTPCRRIGLSRKRKTPSSTLKSLSEDLNSNSDCSLTSLETTPVNHRKALRKRELLAFDTTSPINPPLTEYSNLKKTNYREETMENNFVEKASKKDLNQMFSLEDAFDCKNITTKFEKEESLIIIGGDDELVNMQNDSLNLNTNMSTDEVNSAHFTDNRSVSKLKSNVKKLTIGSSDLFNVKCLSVKDKPNTQKNTETVNYENEMVVSDFEEDFKVYDKHSHKKIRHSKDSKSTKQIRKALSIKKSMSFTDDEFEGDSDKVANNPKESKAQIHRLSKSKAILDENKNTNIKSSEKSVDIPVATCDDADDDNTAFTSTPEQEKNKKKDLIQKIKVLENQIKIKQQRLVNLKQASIYKNKHNVESLNQITSTWISGSVSGLNDLLKQLQTHGPITMSTLLNNMHIPSEIVSKLPLDVE